MPKYTSGFIFLLLIFAGLLINKWSKGGGEAPFSELRIYGLGIFPARIFITFYTTKRWDTDG